MPIFDFMCTVCEKDFEDVVIKSEIPSCPHCGSDQVQKKVSAPSPLKSKGFPFKVGPVHPSVKLAGQGKSACPAASSGGCGSGGGGGFS